MLSVTSLAEAFTQSLLHLKTRIVLSLLRRLHRSHILQGMGLYLLNDLIREYNPYRVDHRAGWMNFESPDPFDSRLARHTGTCVNSADIEAVYGLHTIHVYNLRK